MKVAICGPVRNCGRYLTGVLNNMLILGKLFDEFVIIISYDHSMDNSLQILHRFKNKHPNIIVYENTEPLLPYRTHRIAKARNECLNIINTTYPTYEYMIMMDCDDVNCKQMNLDVVKKHLRNPAWDSLSFMTAPVYYDIWGLSIYPYTYSYNHFNNSVQQYSVIQQYVTNLLRARKNELVRCISAFNGFALYRMSKFKNCKYDGGVNLRLLPPHMLNAHMKASRSPLVMKIYPKAPGVNGYHEDCEHRAFHVQAITKNNAAICISSDIVFTRPLAR